MNYSFSKYDILLNYLSSQQSGRKYWDFEEMQSNAQRKIPM